MFDFLADLNPEQRAAATFEAPVPLRIVAGAGTGKTTALASRVAWLLAAGTPPERVLLLTFTRRAARQLLARTETMLAKLPAPRRGAGRVQGGTFHSIAHRTLRRHAPRLGLPDGFSILDTADAADLFDLVRDQQRARRPRPPAATQGDAARPVLAAGEHRRATARRHRRWSRRGVPS